MRTSLAYVLGGFVLGVAVSWAYVAFPLSPEQHVKEALGLSPVAMVTLNASSGDYYSFNVQPNGDEGGGYLAIVKKLPNGRYMNLWQGNASGPYCDEVDQYGIPTDAGLYPGNCR